MKEISFFDQFKIKNKHSDYLIEGLNKRNCKRILLKKGFYKHKKPYSFSKWIKINKRVHIQFEEGGFYWHTDNH